MNTNIKKISAMFFSILMITTIFVGMATPVAASGDGGITPINTTDENDNIFFVNETITITWRNRNLTTPVNYINITNLTGNISATDVTAYDIRDGHFRFKYKVPLNPSINITELHHIFINTNTTANCTWYEVRAPLIINNITEVTLSTPMNRTKFTCGKSVLIGDVIKVDVTTYGPLRYASRKNARLNWLVNNNTEWGLDTNTLNKNFSSLGNFTAEIWTNLTNIGVGENFNISINSPTMQSNEFINKSIVQFNVTDLTVDISAVKQGTTHPNFFTRFNTTNLTGVNQHVDRTYNFTVTICNVRRPEDRWNFTTTMPEGNITLSNDNKIAYLQINAGNYTVYGLENLNLTVGSTEDNIGKIRIENTTIGFDRTFYYKVGERNLTIIQPPALKPIYIGQNITISGIYINTTQTASLNVTATYVNDPLINVTLNSTTGLYNATHGIDNISEATDTLHINETFDVIWNTNTTWNETHRVNQLPAGKWRINVSNHTGALYATRDIMLKEYLSVSTDVTSTVLSKPFNITVESSRINNTLVNFNLTEKVKGSVINSTLNTTLDNFGIVDDYRSNATKKVNLSDGNSLNKLIEMRDRWNDRKDTGNAFIDINVYANTTTLSVNNTTIIRLWNNMTLEVPNTVVAGQNVTINGTITRLNGTGVNLSVRSAAHPGIPVCLKLSIPTNNNETFGFNETTRVSNFTLEWNTTRYVDNMPLPYGRYYITVNDSFVNKTVPIILKTGELTVDDVTVVPGDKLNITGTSARTDGTRINITLDFKGIGRKDLTANVQNGVFFNNTTFAKFACGAPFPPGTYNISVTDGTLTATANLIVVSPEIIIVSPTPGYRIAMNDSVIISGTTNRHDDTRVNITIMGPRGYRNATTIYTCVQREEFNVTWDTSDAYAYGMGTYFIKVEIVGKEVITSVELIPAIPLPELINVTPDPATFNVTDTYTFNAEVLPAGVDQNVTWSVDNETVGTIDATGIFTANATGTVNVTATSVVYPHITGTATVTVKEPIVVLPKSIAITPDPATLNVTENITFTAKVLPVGANQSVTWSVTNVTVGTIDATTGLFTALSLGIVNVTATSVVDPYITGTATVNVTKVVDWNPWDDADSEDGVTISLDEITEAIGHWADDRPSRGHIITMDDILELIGIWAAG